LPTTELINGEKVKMNQAVGRWLKKKERSKIFGGGDEEEFYTDLLLLRVVGGY